MVDRLKDQYVPWDVNKINIMRNKAFTFSSWMWGLETKVQICILTSVRESWFIMSGENTETYYALLVKLSIYFLEKTSFEAIVISEEREDNMKVTCFKWSTFKIFLSLLTLSFLFICFIILSKDANRIFHAFQQPHLLAFVVPLRRKSQYVNTKLWIMRPTGWWKTIIFQTPTIY